MRKVRPSLSLILLVFSGTVLALPICEADSQALPGAVRLGMSLPQLRLAVPQLSPLPHAIHLAGRLVGKWSAPAVTVADVALTPIFFFADGELHRVEFSAGHDGGTDVKFAALRTWGRSCWGPELATRGPEGVYASWSTQDLDIYLRQSSAPTSVLRLVVKDRIVKDGSEL